MDRDGITVIEDEPYEGFFRRRRSAPRLDHSVDSDRYQLGQTLRDRREAMGLTLDEVAEITRVRRAYLESFEQAAYDVLPARAFAVGYIRAYARALNLDEELLADMFKREVADSTARLQAPSGAALEDIQPNYRAFVVAAACLVAAIVIWNIVQHKPGGLRRNGEALSDVAISAPDLIRGGLVFTARKKAAPPDQDVPPLYVTPGLEAGFAELQAARGDVVAHTETGGAVLRQRKAFNPRGAIYGAAPENSYVTIQATRPANLVVRSTDGLVFFAQALGAGESYRIPRDAPAGMLLDISDPKAFEVYYNGEFAGGIDLAISPAQKLNLRAEAAARTLETVVDPTVVAAPPVNVSAPLEAPKPMSLPGPIPYGPAVRPPAAAPVSRSSAPSASATSSVVPASSAAEPVASEPAGAAPEPSPTAPATPQ